ncbi:bestrophin family protein [Pontibacter silvestris]|uniref:Bestrophin family protein n=1 Tax=Pontibacter silvestris TaxID=2305183 RepID=A0ABW4WTA4_9BACT|nr:bestrophin family ion channel [Pontibacter silvestris]
MITRRNLKWRLVVHYTWKSMLYYMLLSIAVYLLHDYFELLHLHLPFNTITALSTALAIFLGFKNNNAYDRWWEGRKIWGLLVNYSRAWTREVITMIMSEDIDQVTEVTQLQHRMVYRHIAFVHALRVFLRKKHAYNETGQQEMFEEANDYSDTISFLSPNEYKVFCQKNNPPNYLLELQGEDLKRAYKKGWLSDFRFVKLEQTLVEFNNIQGRSERIKNTPFPRQYSFFSRVFVFIHASLLPFVFVEELGWAAMPVSVIISFVFLCLDLVGERAEDPFENRLEDVPLTSLSLTIETNVKEQWGEKDFPEKRQTGDGVVL